MKSISRLPLGALSLRAFLPILIVAAAALAALATNPTPAQGLRLGYQNGEVVVASVEYGSEAYVAGLESGQVLARVEDRDVLTLSAVAKRDLAGSLGPWNRIATVSPADAAANEAAEAANFAPLIAAARNSTSPWLSDPENNPVGWISSCSWAEHACVYTVPDEFPMVSVVLNPGQTMTVCLPTDGPAFAIISRQNPSAPVDGRFCVEPGSPSPYSYTSEIGGFNYRYVAPYEQASVGPFTLGLAILALGWLGIRRGWAGAGLRPYALTLPVATAAPVLMAAVDRYPSAWAVVVASLLVPLAMIPLAIDFIGRLEGGRRRRLVGLVVVGLAVLSAVAGLLTPAYADRLQVPNGWLDRALMAGEILSILVLPLMLLPKRVLPLSWRRRPIAAAIAIAMLLLFASVGIPDYTFVSELRFGRVALAGGVVFLPGLLAARPFQQPKTGGAIDSGRTPRTVIESADLALAAMTPGIAALCLVNTHSVLTWPIMAWLIAVPIAMRFVLMPLGRAATSAQRQRDLVVAATEAERMRIAADINDEALRDLTMLVRRLDAAGDAANSDAAREIAERLRAICGDLRLPVLNDLGVGPALEWLCGRLGPASKSITLDRSAADEVRLPADIELAVFRIAQEALSNSVRHGVPPMVVRYRTRTDRVELTVDDSGPGIPDGAAELAEQTGHMGLMNMTQRAGAIGATLEIGRKPGGGTRVSLVWEREAAPDGVAVQAPAPA